MQQTDEARRGASSTKGEARQRSEDSYSDEIAWVNEVARLLEPVHAR